MPPLCWPVDAPTGDELSNGIAKGLTMTRVIDDVYCQNLCTFRYP